MSHEQATPAEDEYLQTIYWLEEAGLPITGANVARAMHVSPPTVHEMVGRLEADGYITRDDDRSLLFTSHGREHAAAVVSRHRLIERLLLADVEEVAAVRVLRFENEAEALLHYLKEPGLAPGLEGTVVPWEDDEVAVEAGGTRLAVTRSVAETVSVAADPSPPQRTALPDQLVLAKERYGR